MELLSTQIKNDLGQVHGIIHAAGIIDTGGTILHRTKPEVRNFLNAKYWGTIILETVFNSQDLDFLVTCSSMTTVMKLAAYGRVSYCAGNEFLDAFASYKQRDNHTQMQAINWPGWSSIGMGKQATGDNMGELDTTFLKATILSPQEGCQAFAKSLYSGYSRLLISKPLLVENMLANRVKGLKNKSNKKQQTTTNNQRTKEYTKPRNDIETTLCGIWENCLGVQDVGINIDFFEIGGDSLTAIQIFQEINSKLEVPKKTSQSIH